ncbi:N-acetylglucosamine kinase [Dermatophagoides farinae]|uniref:N-acetyl-D-glucosamine kinase n=1 Tax=Dermatophagoides farinae TaxID=6954 RepID=A0A922LA47_DERFA|nr:N-acetyl-D-glucosamine kinase-like [Dermatophagoides farinae]XP_046911218.1 N-acetyl-D-glucosamine kinase-like [Dermatophagoides farinae]KAH7641975.1 benzoyl-coa reductase subunit-like protein [Dermatophagoides farinae]KAH9529076.1 hypothetical protein DERF_002985 [Dermatophagoides farinae]
MKVFAGIEGGASFSKVALLDENGCILSRLDAEPGSNIMLMSKQEWVDRIYQMVLKATHQLPKRPNGEGYQLESIGLCLSGCENEEENLELCELLKSKHPELCQRYSIASDTIGSMMTCNPDGGIVLIAGTGSNCLLIYSDGSQSRCGGWGHIIGDHGSAYSISIRAIRYIIEHEENYAPIEYDVSNVREIVFDHFRIDNYFDLIKPLYQEFDKSYIAQLCARIAKLATEKNDPLALKLFNEAGKALAQHVKALLPKIEQDEISVICVGSLFKSWSLLENEFLNEIGHIQLKLNMLYCNATSAIGAAYYGAKVMAKIKLPIDYEKNYQTLCSYRDGQKVY